MEGIIMSEKPANAFGARAEFETGNGPAVMYRLDRLEKEGIAEVSRLPVSIKILLESLLRNCDGKTITEADIAALAAWKPDNPGAGELAFMPARVLLQDFTGVPAVVDLAALRSAMLRMGGDAERINPLIPVDLVIDHSIQVDFFGSPDALEKNAEREFERNRERYELLRWAQGAFKNFRVVPPDTGIVHQVNLEYLACVVETRRIGGDTAVFPDSLVGTDSHTTMINGLGVLGWGVGGIEAEAVMLGQPYYMLPPQVVGFKLKGGLAEGATATDLVLTVTEMLRKKGVVGKFVEFFGPGLSRLSLPDRTTIANMSPEYGATMGFFPVGPATLDYLRLTGRGDELAVMVERYTKEQGLFVEGKTSRTNGAPEPRFTDTLELDMGTVVPSLAGPKRPQDRIPLGEMKRSFHAALRNVYGRKEKVKTKGEVSSRPRDGSVVIAAITSCTNTSNPSVMIGAGLLAKKAVEHGLTVPEYVKTSLAPGSRVVTRYLEASGLMPYMEKLRFHVVGYGCTTCIGNSGPIPPAVAQAIKEEDLVAAAVLSGNRNFEGRINPLTRANYLASPPLVIAYALAGRVDIDFQNEPIGIGADGASVFLKDIWPSQEEISNEIKRSLDADMFRSQYSSVFEGSGRWREMPVPVGDIYKWNDESTYIQEPPFFMGLSPEAPSFENIRGARALALLGDSVTTDHISPAGAFAAESPSGSYLVSRGIEPQDFNSFGSRRGNHEVMMRGTFGNIRLRNLLAPGTEGGVTIHLPSGEEMSIYDAAVRYQKDSVPLVVIAGREYGTGSSRDWAAKGTQLLGVKAVLAESYERIHRSNLVGMGVLPLQFMPGENRESLGLTGREVFDIEGLDGGFEPGAELTVRVRTDVGGDGDGTKERTLKMTARIDTAVEVTYYQNGGILHTVLRDMLREG